VCQASPLLTQSVLLWPTAGVRRCWMVRRASLGRRLTARRRPLERHQPLVNPARAPEHLVFLRGDDTRCEATEAGFVGSPQHLRN